MVDFRSAAHGGGDFVLHVYLFDIRLAKASA